ncbi:hypothetical protein J4221_03360 [Candidatus Pacearchaeota archaeon]|nr:hypothetical protein [Candidatus Pacearchaeota archaeon]
MQQVIDIVLLPPKDITDKIIELNHSLKRDSNNPRIVLGEYCLPHISLLIGIVPIKYIPIIKASLNYISQTFKPPNLEFTNIDYGDLQTKNQKLKIAGFALKSSQELIELHEKLIQETKRYLIDAEITKDMFFNPEEIDEEDTPWIFDYIRNFIKNSSYDKFAPHITIGDGELEKALEQELNFPISFTASRLALCHLGNYCTCRKVLYEVRLRGK